MNVLTKSTTNRTQLAMDKLQKLACRWLTNDELMLVLESNKQSGKNQDAAIFHILHSEFGFTAEQLKQVFKKYQEKYCMIDRNFDAAIANIEEVELLKDIGVDIDAMYEEYGL